MLARAEHFMPSLGKLTATRIWTGMRPTTADKLPIIGPSSAVDGVWIAAGHEGLGITTSLATGALTVAMISGATPAIDVTPFSAARTTIGWN
jgi:glycine/D-amino acid oxidase-like deaminating enzyme